MKNNYIKDLQFKDKLSAEQFAVKNVKNGKTANGRDFMDLILVDWTGEITAKIWEDALPNCAVPKVGEIVEINGTVEEFRDKQQLKITFLQKAEKYDLADFLPKTEKNIEEMWQTVQQKINGIEDKKIKELLKYFFDDNELAEKFKQAPAAEMIHHAYVGGLLDHSLEMLTIAESVQTVFPNLNNDLLTCGILLHDIGKLDELAMNHVIYRTIEGNLHGHISIGAIMVGKAIEKIGNMKVETANQIIHMILSHHGELEFGSPVKPMTREALALHFLDNLSTKVKVADKIISDNQNNDADFSEKNFALNSRVYLK
ncbi:HD domain-containing protein [Patescibacteria group bacterium]|nr:HD domain-containing protein [Patescibacteria group bacterium]